MTFSSTTSRTKELEKVSGMSQIAAGLTKKTKKTASDEVLVYETWR
jgi:hypothetical protein